MGLIIAAFYERQTLAKARHIHSCIMAHEHMEDDRSESDLSESGHTHTFEKEINL